MTDICVSIVRLLDGCGRTQYYNKYFIGGVLIYIRYALLYFSFLGT